MTSDEVRLSEEKSEEKQSWQFVKWVFRVLYSPMKAFEEIVKKPDIKGPILILLITLPIILGGRYISGTKFFLETPAPENDLWTEKLFNSSSLSWSSNGNVTLDNNDYIVGNHSVSSSLINSSLIWLRLTGIGSFNCSKEEYNRLSFRIKWANTNVTPAAATLQLFSFNNESSRFESDIEPLLANNTNVWTNVTVNLTTEDWTATNSPSWDNITGIGFQLMWPDLANLTLKIDDLFFGKYTSISSSNTFQLQLLYSLVQSSTDFLLEWLILSGMVLLVLKSFSDWTGIWKSLFAILGYVYSNSIVYLGLLLFLFLLLPPIFLPYNITYSEYIDIYQGSWGIPISILSVLSYGWTILLCTIALKKLHELSWSKAILTGLGTVVLSLLFSSLLLSILF